MLYNRSLAESFPSHFQMGEGEGRKHWQLFGPMAES
jgi:hypothetical protein